MCCRTLADIKKSQTGLLGAAEDDIESKTEQISSYREAGGKTSTWPGPLLGHRPTAAPGEHLTSALNNKLQPPEALLVSYTAATFSNACVGMWDLRRFLSFLAFSLVRKPP